MDQEDNVYVVGAETDFEKIGDDIEDRICSSNPVTESEFAESWLAPDVSFQKLIKNQKWALLSGTVEFFYYFTK